ncbi:hypothetical protein GALL_199790 [mine drainage metagenome]|uniref:Uncharacterized protein n=1 Tax=mine drainage metagenome TaxID=410659 RepID=A0A1J5RR09_9ZZZZ
MEVRKCVWDWLNPSPFQHQTGPSARVRTSPCPQPPANSPTFEGGIQIPPSSFRPPTSDLPTEGSDPSSRGDSETQRNRTSDLCLLTSDLSPPSSVFRLPTSDLRFPTSALCPPTSDVRPPTSDLRLLTSDLCPLTSDFRPPISDLRLPLLRRRLLPRHLRRAAEDVPLVHHRQSRFAKRRRQLRAVAKRRRVLP